jgi:hypothetical protein
LKDPPTYPSVEFLKYPPPEETCAAAPATTIPASELPPHTHNNRVLATCDCHSIGCPSLRRRLCARFRSLARVLQSKLQLFESLCKNAPVKLRFDGMRIIWGSKSNRSAPYSEVHARLTRFMVKCHISNVSESISSPSCDQPSRRGHVESNVGNC